MAMYVNNDDEITTGGNENREDAFGSLLKSIYELEQDAKIRDAHKEVNTDDLPDYLYRNKEVNLAVRKANLLDTRELNDTKYNFVVEVLPVTRSEAHDGFGEEYSPAYFKLAMYLVDKDLQKENEDNPKAYSEHAFYTEPISLGSHEDHRFSSLSKYVAEAFKELEEEVKNSNDEKDKLCFKYVKQYVQDISKGILEESKVISSSILQSEKDWAFLFNQAKDVELTKKRINGLNFKKLNEKYLDKDVTIKVDDCYLYGCNLLKKEDNIKINSGGCTLDRSTFVDVTKDDKRLQIMVGLEAKDNNYYLYMPIPSDFERNNYRYEDKSIRFNLGSDISKVPHKVKKLAELTVDNNFRLDYDFTKYDLKDISVSYDLVPTKEADIVLEANKDKVAKIASENDKISDIQILQVLSMQKEENLQHLYVIGAKDKYDRGFIADAKGNFIGSINTNGVFATTEDAKAPQLANGLQDGANPQKNRKALIQAEAISINPAEFLNVLKNAKSITVDTRYSKEFEPCLSAIAETQKNNELVSMNKEQFERLNGTLQEKIVHKNVLSKSADKTLDKSLSQEM